MITNEIKAKVFAPYIFQKVLHNGVDVVALDKSWNWSHPSFKLILRPLSEITDEEMKDIVMLEFLLGFNKYFADENEVSEQEISISEIERTDEEIIAHINCRCFEGKFSIQLKSARISTFDEEGDPAGVADSLTIHQYLQSKGYDLPHFLLGGKTLKEAGLAIYESEINTK